MVWICFRMESRAIRAFSMIITPLLTKPLINEEMMIRILTSTARNEALTSPKVDGEEPLKKNQESPRKQGVILTSGPH